MTLFTLIAAIILLGMWISISAAFLVAKATYSQDIEAQSLAYVKAMRVPCIMFSVACLVLGVLLDITCDPYTLYLYSN